MAELSFVPAAQPPSSQQAERLCEDWDFQLVKGQSLNPELEEMSGLAFSRHWDDLLYHIADSENPPHLLVSDSLMQRFRAVPYADENRDTEDLAVAACPEGGSCLFIADTGDNFHLRKERFVYVVREDALAGSVQGQQLRITFPEQQALDVEALAVAPDGRELYFFSKEKAKTQVFSVSWDGHSNDLRPQKIAELSRTMVTGASFHPSARRILLINLEGALELSMEAKPGFQKTQRTWFPYERKIALMNLAQQEAIAYAPDGLSFIYSSERKPWSYGPWGLVWARCRLR